MSASIPSFKDQDSQDHNSNFFSSSNYSSNPISPTKAALYQFDDGDQLSKEYDLDEYDFPTDNQPFNSNKELVKARKEIAQIKNK